MILLLGIFSPPILAESPFNRDVADREDDPVLVLGSALPDYLGVPVEDLALYRYASASHLFLPVPFQVDERVLHTFNEGTALEFDEWIYDVFGEDDGLLDENDEIVFMFGDSGDRVPDASQWLDGADVLRFELEVTDQRPGHPEETGWVYVFHGTGLPTSSVDHISWAGTASSDVVTDSFTLEYDDRWLLTGYRVHAPCGTGQDLIDRVKGRALTELGIEEDEESWNENSEYLGGLEGAVRAIRYVRGARSGVNTIHADIIYNNFWEREIDLRVHAITEAVIYLDWLPRTGARFFSPQALLGVPVDGLSDAVPDDFVDWCVYRSAAGGIVALNDVPDSPYYQDKVFHYLDDATHDDAIPVNPGYGDEDDSAYGNMGLKILETVDSNIDPISMTLHLYPLCADTGDGNLGTEYQSRHAYPLNLDAMPQWKVLGPIVTLETSRDVDDLLLDWEPVAGASAYRVYRSSSAGMPHSSWELRVETQETTFRDLGEAAFQGTWYYSVAVVGEGGQEEW